MILSSPLRRSKSMKLQRHQTTSRRVKLLQHWLVVMFTIQLIAEAQQGQTRPPTILWGGLFRCPLHLDPPCSATHFKCVPGVTRCHPRCTPTGRMWLCTTHGRSFQLERLRDQLLSDLVLRFIVSWGLWRINTGRPMRITTPPTTP